MRPTVSGTLSTVTSGTPIQLDPSKETFNVGIGVVVTSTINFTVQYSHDDWGSLTTWHDISALASKTANTSSNLTVPATAVRLTVNSVTGGTAVMTVIQAG